MESRSRAHAQARAINLGLGTSVLLGLVALVDGVFWYAAFGYMVLYAVISLSLSGIGFLGSAALRANGSRFGRATALTALALLAFPLWRAIVTDRWTIYGLPRVAGLPLLLMGCATTALAFAVPLLHRYRPARRRPRPGHTEPRSDASR